VSFGTNIENQSSITELIKIMNKLILSFLLISAILVGNIDVQAQSKRSRKSKKVKVQTLELKENQKAKVELTEEAPAPPSFEAGPGPRSGAEPKTQTASPNDVLAEIQTISEPVVEVKPKGSINWTDQFIEVTGSSAIDAARFTNPAQAQLMGTRGAVVDAQRNLLEIIEGVKVTGETTVKDMVTESDVVKTKVEGVVKNARVIGEPIIRNGMVTVTMRAPLYKDGLANALVSGTAASTASGEIPEDLPEAIALRVNGKYNPRLLPNITDQQKNVLLDMAKAYDPTNGKFPELLKAGKDTYEKLKGKQGLEIIDVLQDASGNLVVPDKAKEKLERWKKIGKTILNIVKTVLLPI
jgi:hypothetical protein